MLLLRDTLARRAAAVLLIPTLSLGGCQEDTREPESAIHVNEAYGFMVGYPGSLTLVERSPRAASVGVGEGAGFEPRVEIVVESGDAESLEAFLQDRVLAACRRPAPDASVACDELTRREPFTSLGGVEGERFHLRQITVRRGGATIEEERGPVYAFPLRGGPTTGRFVVLLIHPPFGDAVTEEELVHLVAVTLRLTSAWVMR
jgi:hypothetical protein